MSALLVESEREAANATYRFVVPAGESWIHEIPQGSVLPDCRSGRQSGGGYAVL